MKKGIIFGINSQNVHFFQFINIHPNLLENVLEAGQASNRHANLKKRTEQQSPKEISKDLEQLNSFRSHSKRHKSKKSHLLINTSRVEIIPKHPLQKKRFSQLQILSPSFITQEQYDINTLLKQINILNNQIHEMKAKMERELEYVHIETKLKTKNKNKSILIKDLNNQLNDRNKQIISLENDLQKNQLSSDGKIFMEQNNKIKDQKASSKHGKSSISTHHNHLKQQVEAFNMKIENNKSHINQLFENQKKNFNQSKTIIFQDVTNVF
jgi:hypothetical protein